MKMFQFNKPHSPGYNRLKTTIKNCFT